MTGSYWIKLYLEILDDSKIAILPDRLWRRIVELFLLAGRYGENGELPETTQLAWVLRIPTDELELDLKQIESIGIIERSQAGWHVTHFAERQAPVSDAKRMEEYRKRIKHDQYNGENPVTNSLRNVTQITDNRLTDNRLTDNRLTESDKNHKDDDGEIFKSFQNNICFLTPILVEKLSGDIDEFGKDFVLEAIKISVENNARNYNYFHKVLENKKTGFNPGKNGKGSRQNTKVDLHASPEGRAHYGEWEKS